MGRRTHLGDATGVTSVAYDALNRVTGVTAPATGNVGYGYDARGLRTRLTYPDSSAIDYTYDNDGHLAGVWQSATQLVTTTYTLTGQPDQTSRANGITTSFGFDGAGRLAYQHTTLPSGTVSEYVYTTDRRGMRTAADETWTARDSADAGTGTGLLGEYYSDTSFGTLVLTRTDSLIDFDWGLGSPDVLVPDETFSVRWTGTVQSRYTEAYTFTTTADDGVRLWINGELIIDDWNPHPTEEHAGTTSTALVAGHHYDITLEYFEDLLTAEVQLEWESAAQPHEIIPTSQLYPPTPPATGTGTGLFGAYYSDVSLSTLVLTRTDSLIDFDWDVNAPNMLVPDDGFSVRWFGTIAPLYTEAYTFITNGDDGVRLWVNGELLIDDWNTHTLEEHAGTTSMVLQAGQQYAITLEYFEDIDTAAIWLEWESAHQAREVIPTSQLSLPVPPATGSGTGALGSYYSDTILSTLVLTRTDSLIDFDWDVNAPDMLVPDDGFSVRWTATIAPLYTEPYTFTTSGDDGVRLWVGDELLIDDWNIHTLEAHDGTTSVPLVAGQTYPITLEYFESADTAAVWIEWESAQQSREMVPTSQLEPIIPLSPSTIPITQTRDLTYTYDGLQRLSDVLEVGPTATTAYSSTYDLAGNRLEAWTDGILVQNRTYDDANQVSGWAYDAAGNLLDDGTTINTWDALNRLMAQGATNNAYNGDGALVAQTNGSGTISYTQDLISPLSQILSDGTNTYIYGADRLFGVASSTRTWYLGDALGSVRQTLDDAGVVQQTQRYDAWGAPQGNSIAPFGYTGELQQGNQVYLRARWYNAGNGAFGSRDPFAGMAEQPYSLHTYQYGYANPVSNTDPSGLCSPTPGQSDDYCQQSNPRDITDWLYRTLIANAHDYRTRTIHNANQQQLPSTANGFEPCAIMGTIIGNKSLAINTFRDLMADKHEWDFKHTIKAELGEGVTYCGVRGCRNDIEYSVAGNLHYGFIAMAAGFTDEETLVGAGVADKFDPAHGNPTSPDYTPYDGVYDPPGLQGLPNYGDNAKDNIAVQYGMRLYKFFTANMTYQQFAASLDSIMGSLDHHQPSTAPVKSTTAAQWPYPVGFFRPR